VKIKNPNIEMRNPKQYQNPNIQNSKQTKPELLVLSSVSIICILVI